MQFVQHCYPLEAVEDYIFSTLRQLSALPGETDQRGNARNQLLEASKAARIFINNLLSGEDSSNGSIMTFGHRRYDVREVWKHNLHQEFHTFRKCIQLFTYVVMDTKSPGVVARPIGEFQSSDDYLYQQLRCNVNLLEIIQLGFTFFDENEKLPSGIPIWHFNFKFDLSENMYEEVSINELENSGIDFNKHKQDGIAPLEFAALLISSGIVLTDNIKWISSHSGRDFAYLVKLLTATDLPEDESEYSELLKIYFPAMCDINNLSKTNEKKNGESPETDLHFLEDMVDC